MMKYRFSEVMLGSKKPQKYRFQNLFFFTKKQQQIINKKKNIHNSMYLKMYQKKSTLT